MRTIILITDYYCSLLRAFVSPLCIILMVLLPSFLSLDIAYGQSKGVKLQMLEFMAKNNKLDVKIGDSLVEFIPLLEIVEVVKHDSNWKREFGVYRFRIISENAPDLVIKNKDKISILNQEKLDETIEAIIDLYKLSNGRIKHNELVRYIEAAINIYRRNEFVKKQILIGSAPPIAVAYNKP